MNSYIIERVVSRNTKTFTLPREKSGNTLCMIVHKIKQILFPIFQISFLKLWGNVLNTCTCNGGLFHSGMKVGKERKDNLSFVNINRTVF